tara:strand:- start:993 stop:1607 length:615 start_codon:yes stop_codon:yes gene_type:complete
MGLISNGTTVFDAGSMASGFGGSMTFIKKVTASSSATISFVDGTSDVVLDNTYKEYLFTFNNIHPATNAATLTFQGNAAGGSGYNETITSTYFQAEHNEAGTGTNLRYRTEYDQAQGTSFQTICGGIGNGNDECGSGYLHLFNPSDTTFVTHFLSNISIYENSDYNENIFTGGYFNTTSAIDEIQFKMSSGNIDAGDICLYGIS